jgi:hypothetical protein
MKKQFEHLVERSVVQIRPRHDTNLCVMAIGCDKNARISVEYCEISLQSQQWIVYFGNEIKAGTPTPTITFSPVSCPYHALAVNLPNSIELALQPRSFDHGWQKFSPRSVPEKTDAVTKPREDIFFNLLAGDNRAIRVFNAGGAGSQIFDDGNDWDAHHSQFELRLVKENTPDENELAAQIVRLENQNFAFTVLLATVVGILFIVILFWRKNNSHSALYEQINRLQLELAEEKKLHRQLNCDE